MEERPDFSPNFGWPDYLFTKTARRNQLVVPKINQEINEPSYEMVGVNITVTYHGQNNRIFGIFFLVDFLFSSLTTPNVFIIHSEISWFCFDFPKWGHSLLPISMFLSSFSNKLIKSEWNSLQLIILKVKHTWKNLFAR